ncbi:MAG TPA: hypothetical protein VGC36_17740, partial [Rhizomicrobium sp.]
AIRLYDLGYKRESNDLYRGCQAASRTCYSQQFIVRNPPPNTKLISIIPFPPNPKTNGGGTVIHETGEMSIYLPPSYDPLANIPPRK